MSCCGFQCCIAKGEAIDGENTGRHCRARRDKFTGCLRKHITRASGRLYSMARLGDKKASYFSAVYSGSRFPTEGEAEAQPILFDKVLSQFPKNVYDPQRGVFTCPKNGAYMFNFSMRPDAPPIQSFNVQLMKEDEPQVSLFSNPSEEGHAGTSSQSCILDVKQGEKVWIRLVRGALRSDVRSPSATFNGTLLRHIKNME